MQMPGRKYSQANTKYRYGFNGKENDKDISEGGQDYGMRIYDVRIAKFLSVDPLTRSYPWYTPYQFAGNSPISNIDLDGAEPDPVVSKISTQAPKPILKVVTKNGVAQSAKVVAMKATEKVLESPGFWSKLGSGALKVGGAAVGTIFWVLTPTSAGEGSVPNFHNRPWANPNPAELPNPNPSNDDGNNNKSKIFYATYTKSKLNEDGSTTTYSGRTSGTYTGTAPTESDANQAVLNRENGHLKLKQEGYSRAVLDEYSTNKAAIRGREQQLIDNNGGAQSEGGTSRNKIRGVGRSNLMRQIYDAAATVSFGKLPSNNPADKKTP
jgi:RHS repeat-associated protein